MNDSRTKGPSNAGRAIECLQNGIEDALAGAIVKSGVQGDESGGLPIV